MSDMKIKVILEEANVNKDFFASNRKENNLKCPFCNKKLEPIGTSGQFQCGTWGCDVSFNFIATRDVWEYIDRTRKALDVAVDALKELRPAEKKSCYLVPTVFTTQRIIDEALEQIKTALEQKDGK